MNAPTIRSRQSSFARWAITLVVVLLAGTLSVPALAHHRPGHGGATAPSHKLFAAEFSATGLDGAALKLSLKVTNKSTDQNLGSVNAWLPGTDIFSTTQPLVGNASLGTNADGDDVLQLRNLSLLPGRSVTVGFTVSGCSGDAWNVQAKQSNEFSGTGNDLGLVVEDSNLTVNCEVFDDFGEAGDCQTQAGETTCTIENDDMKIEVSGTLKENAEDAFILLALLEVDLDCGDEFNHAPNTTLFDVAGFVEPMTVTMTIFAGTAGLASASSYQVCFLGDDPFWSYGEDGENNVISVLIDEPVNGPYGPALLHDCPTPDFNVPEPHGDFPYPCVLAWSNDILTGDRIIEFLVPAKDPMWR